MQAGCHARVYDTDRVVLIARFDGNIAEPSRAYDRAHALIMGRGGAVSSGELHHHCATSEKSLSSLWGGGILASRVTHMEPVGARRRIF